MGGGAMLLLLLCLSAGALFVQAEDPYVFFNWNITYGNLNILGTPQQVILINGSFPGPRINCTSNNNIVVNMFNNLDEPFLMTWAGLQHRKNSWQDGVLGTNCPIPPGKNYTFKFQAKDQIGGYIYYPSIGMQRAAGGVGMITVHSRPLIPIPYPPPEDEHIVLISDWYSKSHKELQKTLDGGRQLGRPDGVLINGKACKPNDKGEPMFYMKAGKTYKYRICNSGIKTTLNFRIQGHTMKLVEMEGSHVVQNTYQSLDLHAGQCLSVLVKADQTPKDYYMIASTRYLKTNLPPTAVIIRYNDSKTPASPDLPKAPVGWAWSLNQFRTFRWNLTSSAARPNPQGSYHYGNINITRTIKLINTAHKNKDGKLRFALSGVSHINPPTPLKLAEYYNAADKVFKYDIIKDSPPADIKEFAEAPIVLNMTFRNFVEIIFENHEKSLQSYHLDGFAFFAVACEPGTWTPEKRKNYNLLDAVSRHTVQVFPNSWSAVLLTFDNAGMWNLRSEIWERTYLGQQLYFSTLSPGRSLRDEYNIPDNFELCGIVKDMPKPPPYKI